MGNRRGGAAGGVGGIVIGVFFVLVACLMAGERLEEVALGRGSENWPRVEGHVVRSSLHQVNARRRRLDFAYHYQVDGVNYVGQRVAFTAPHKGNVVESYPPEAVVTVRYSPDRPEISVLEPGVGFPALAGSVLPFLVLSFLGAAFVFWGLRVAFRL